MDFHQPMQVQGKDGKGGYRLLAPSQKYSLAFCTPEEIAIWHSHRGRSRHRRPGRLVTP